MPSAEQVANEFAPLTAQSRFRGGNLACRLDECIASREAGSGFLERSHFAEAYASLWIDGGSTHELTIAHDVLRTRRRIVAQPPGWALTPGGLRSLREQAWLAPSFGAGDIAERRRRDASRCGWRREGGG